MLRRVCATAMAALITVGLAACGDRSDPAGAKRDVDRGLKAHVAGRYGEAKKRYQAAIKKDDENKLAYYNLGLIEQTLGRPVAAETAYRVTLKLDPDYQPALFNLAILREQAKDYAEAASLYRHAVAVNPSDATAHLNLGLLLRDRMGQVAEGQAELAKALELDPTLADRAGAPAAPKPAA